MIRKPRYTVRELGKKLTVSRNKLKTVKGRENRKQADLKKISDQKFIWESYNKQQRLKVRSTKTDNPVTAEKYYDKIVEIEQEYNILKERNRKSKSSTATYKRVERNFSNELLVSFTPSSEDFREDDNTIRRIWKEYIDPKNMPATTLVILEGENKHGKNAFHSVPFVTSEMEDIVADKEKSFMEELYFTLAEKDTGIDFVAELITIRFIWREDIKK